jgi:DNA polymerase
VKLHEDFETRSAADLVKVGLYAYAEHPSTEILCVAWALDDATPAVWFPRREPIPATYAAARANPAVVVGAHNTGFERIMAGSAAGRRIGLGPLPRERYDCTAARAARCGLPRTLEGASAALALPVAKDKEGAALMRRMSRPVKPRRKRGEPPAPPGAYEWLDDDANLDRLGAYCCIDVAVEQAIDRKLPPLRPDERETWLLTEAMNDRGIAVDSDLLLSTLLLVESAEAEISAELARLTGQPFPSLHHAYVTRWLVSLGYDDLIADGVGKAAVAALLERSDIDPLVRSVLTIRQEGGGTASKKYAAILNRLSLDGRLRGVLVYCGAAATGRWSSRGAQLQNLVRMALLKKPAPLAAAIRDVCAGATPGEVADLHGPPIVIAGELLRPTLTASPTAWLARGDSKQIEARVLPWLAGAGWKLDRFRAFDAGTGPDLYKVAAAGIYKTTPDQIADDDPRRQIGKVSELALGFGGGAGALQAMARGYGIKIPHCPELNLAAGDVAPEGTDEWIKQEWRRANPECSDRETGLWARIERAALECARDRPGPFHPVGDLGLGFVRNSEAMVFRLPSGNSLFYWNPRVADRLTPWGERRPCVVYRAEDSVTRQWREFDGYGGLWTENCVQATARDLMAFWLRLLDREGLAPVLTVHDEGVCDVARARFPLPDDAAHAVEQIMKQTPPWGAGLPVSADSSAGPRYVK